MRKLSIIIGMMIALAFVLSCEDQFSPRADYDERYSLNCLIRTDTNYHIATTMISYDVPGVDPYANTIDPFIEGSFIRMWRGDDLFIFRDSTIERIDNSRYNTPTRFYYINNFIPEPGDTLDIEALLPNGRRLKSTTSIPNRIYKRPGSSDILIPPDDGRDYIHIEWVPNYPQQVFRGELNLYYQKLEGGSRVRHIVRIPWRFVEKDGEKIEVFHSPSQEVFIEYTMELIEETLESISQGDPNKQNYFIYSVILDLTMLDRNLSAYYSSVAKIGDSFSLRLDEVDFSNIEGGFGIFGSLNVQKLVMFFRESYLEENFGYRNEYDP
jgi:hypothetical protein